MNQINAETIRRERHRRKLSLRALAEKAEVDVSTLHRIETGRTSRNASHVIERLADKLGLTPEQLTAEPAHTGDAPDEGPVSYRSQFNVRISHEARNALALVARRYNVRMLDIIEFAPLLFHILAAESLKERKRRLEELSRAREQIAALASSFPHLTERLVNDWDADFIEEAERCSIDAADIRGFSLDDDASCQNIRRINRDWGQDNPFVVQLRERLVALGEEGDEIECWYNGSIPRYSILKAEAIAYLDDDEDAANSLLEGMFGLHELPKELREPEVARERVAWIRKKVDEDGDRCVAWLDTLPMGELNL